ncbi:MAG: thermonuclease family protein [Aestuariivirga sp.]|uniref:thermonuclease family protein n=1 Tax=Aestuariivirga sp. TaxID=2650926 RepID=UPI0030166835
MPVATVRPPLTVILLVIVLFLAFPFPGQAESLAGQASVIDGDTIEIHGQRIRLFGIDAVESRQRCTRDGKPWDCGKDSAFALADRVGRSAIDCQGSEHDRYGRLVAICFKGGEDLNRWMVEQGWAVAYRHYSLDYVGAEDAAKAARRGLWSGSFEMPWEWRKTSR